MSLNENDRKEAERFADELAMWNGKVSRKVADFLRRIAQEQDSGEAVKDLEERIKELEDFLLQSGFVKCDLPACNCGSYHHRFYAHPQRAMTDEALEATLVACEMDIDTLAAHNAELQVEIAELRKYAAAKLADAASAIAEWGAYAGEYFKERWNLAADIERFTGYATAMTREMI